MNLKNVLRTYGLLRSLTDNESALLETLRGLSESDREQLVESLSPSGGGKKKAAKKPVTTREYDYCLRCGTTKRDSSHKDQASPDYHEFKSSKPKSRRAASLAEQIKSTGKVKSSDDSDDLNAHCQKEFDGGFVCDEPADANVHHLRGATGYHEFVVGVPVTEPSNDPSESAAIAGAGD